VINAPANRTVSHIRTVDFVFAILSFLLSFSSPAILFDQAEVGKKHGCDCANASNNKLHQPVFNHLHFSAVQREGVSKKNKQTKKELGESSKRKKERKRDRGSRAERKVKNTRAEGEGVKE